MISELRRANVIGPLGVQLSETLARLVGMGR